MEGYGLNTTCLKTPTTHLSFYTLCQLDDSKSVQKAEECADILVKEGGGACTCDSTLGDRTLQTSCLRHLGNFVQGSGQQVAEGVGRDSGLHGDIPDQAPLLPQQRLERELEGTEMVTHIVQTIQHAYG